MENSEADREEARTNWRLVYLLVVLNTLVLYGLLWAFSEAFK